MDQQKDATGITTLAPSYEEAVRQTAARRVNVEATGNPMPDTPSGAPHLNPALNPAPARIEIPDRIPVPVINDPGLVGANPPLHVLNTAYRDDAMGDQRLPDQTMGMTEQKQQQAITEAARRTQDDIGARAKDQADKALGDATATLKRSEDPPKAPQPGPAPQPIKKV